MCTEIELLEEALHSAQDKWGAELDKAMAVHRLDDAPEMATWEAVEAAERALVAARLREASDVKGRR